jgi:hypothetical protein
LTASPDSRPDPLAEPEGYGRKPGPAEEDLGTCTARRRLPGSRGLSEPCSQPVVMIMHWGCTRGEHAGRSPFCAEHERETRMFPLTCGMCEVKTGTKPAVKVFRREQLAPLADDMPPEASRRLRDMFRGRN